MKKITPTLPGASRMQMPMSSGKSASKIKKVSGTVKRGMVSKNPYC
ncbi:hypothetical protein [Lutibacter sp.]